MKKYVMVQALSRLVSQGTIDDEVDELEIIQMTLDEEVLDYFPEPRQKEKAEVQDSRKVAQLTIYGGRLSFLPELKGRKSPSLEIEKNIYFVPVWTNYEYIPTFSGRPAVGVEGWAFLSEGKNKIEARLNLTKSPEFSKNWNNLPPEERRGLQPFTLRKGMVEKILDCPLRHKNIREEYTCGEPIHSVPDEYPFEYENSNKNNGTLGMCCIMGYDSLELKECPYRKGSPFDLHLHKLSFNLLTSGHLLEKSQYLSKS